MSSIVCPKCLRSVEPAERIVRDKKKTWLIKSCPYERCLFNIDIEPTSIQIWNERSKFFEDLP